MGILGKYSHLSRTESQPRDAEIEPTVGSVPYEQFGGRALSRKLVGAGQRGRPAAEFTPRLQSSGATVAELRLVIASGIFGR